jgi:hypothetical protein
MWFILEEEEEEEDEEELGRPPKLMLMLGRRALKPSCHSFTLRPSIELLFSAEREKNTFKSGISENIRSAALLL